MEETDDEHDNLGSSRCVYNMKQYKHISLGMMLNSSVVVLIMTLNSIWR